MYKCRGSHMGGELIIIIIIIIIIIKTQNLSISFSLEVALHYRTSISR